MAAVDFIIIIILNLSFPAIAICNICNVSILLNISVYLYTFECGHFYKEIRSYAGTKRKG